MKQAHQQVTNIGIGIVLGLVHVPPRGSDPHNCGGAAGMVTGWILAQLHLRFFDARYVERGRLDRLLSLGTGAARPPAAPDSETAAG